MSFNRVTGAIIGFIQTDAYRNRTDGSYTAEQIANGIDESLESTVRPAIEMMLKVNEIWEFGNNRYRLDPEAFRG
ncbi:hypothetical protein ACFLQN_02205 [Candidatus Aenigmatarchaeota archaeon]